MTRFARAALIVPLLWVSLAAQTLTLEDIFQNSTYRLRSIRLAGWVDGGAGYITSDQGDDGRQYVRHDVATGEESLLLSASQLVIGGQQVAESIDGLTLSPDEAWALVPTGTISVWRRSSRAAYYLHHFASAETRPLSDSKDLQQAPSFSPDGRSVAYVRKNNLYVLNLANNRTRQLTKDGGFRIINGHGDWLYEEEFSLTRAYAWSPDSKSIAYLRFHQWPGLDEPKTYPLVDEMQTYPEIFYLPYPKVGEKNSVMRLGVVNVGRGRTRWIDLGPETDIYIPRLGWTGRKNEIWFYRLDRRQQNLELLTADAKTRKTKLVARQHDPAWVSLTDDLHFIDGGQRFLWTDEKSGYRHIYLREIDSGSETAITSGDWEVSSIVGVDEGAGQVVFNSKRDGSAQRQVYRVAFDGSGMTRLTPLGGWHTVQLAPDFSHYIHQSSDINTPPTWTLNGADGTVLRVLLEAALPDWGDDKLPTWELFNVTTTDGTELRAKILKPPGFDPSRKYPTLIYTYGGPGSQQVLDLFGGSRGRDLWHRYMAQQGYVILTSDNRGTGGRGKAFRNLSYGDLGKWSLHDQIETAKWVGRQSWGIPGRVGIWGWSGGGYLTALALTAGAEYFKMGIAIAPVTDFRLYDTAWTERYMGLVTENEAGYNSTDVLSHLDGYRGGLLIVHGTGDDNVHAQNTWQMVDGLVKRNAEFDMMMYPNKNHGLPGTHYHLYSRMTRFVRERL